jgi:hypothetical protein
MTVVVALAGCQTPYQTTMGFTGGVVATPVGNGTYVIRSAVNGYTSQGTAYAHAYRRAGEICPGGYQLADSANSSTSSYWRTTYGVQQVNKPEVTLVIQCSQQPRPAAATHAPTQPPSSTIRWWCVAHTGGRLGDCYRGREWCEHRRSSSLAMDATTTYCEPKPVAVCFGVAIATAPGGSDDSCHTTDDACAAQREYVIAHPDQATALTECRSID